MERVGRDAGGCDLATSDGSSVSTLLADEREKHEDKVQRTTKRCLRDAEENPTSANQMIFDTESSKRERKQSVDSDTETLTHEELLELTSSTLDSLLKGDTILSDLPSDVTVEEVASQIALVQGQSMTVTVAQADGQQLNVVVAQSGTVIDLKRAIQRHVTLKLSREGRANVKVNWRYVWRSNWLALADGTKLTQDNAKLSDVGVRNKSRVKYIKRLHEKNRLY